MDEYIFGLIFGLLVIVGMRVVALWAYGVGYRKAESDAVAKAAAASATAAPQAPSAVALPEPPRPQQVDLPVAIGNRFTYLGVEMLCVTHTVLTAPFGMPSAGIRAEYVDRDGVVRVAAFLPNDMQALKAELMRGKA